MNKDPEHLRSLLCLLLFVLIVCLFAMICSQALLPAEPSPTAPGGESAAEPKVRDTVWGDADGDGEVGSGDLLLLRRYFKDLNYETGESGVLLSSGADANADGSISTDDMLLLRQYLIHYDYSTGKSSVILGR